MIQKLYDLLYLIRSKLPQNTQHDSPIQGNRYKPAIYIATVIVCIFVTSVLTTTLSTAYYNKLETEKKITEMQSFLDDWHRKNNELNNYTMRPVEPVQVDKVQTDIIFRLQAYGLNLITMKELKQQEKNGRIYTVEFSGPYESVMKCLQSFQESGALVGIKHLLITAKDGNIHTKVTYKIYTK